MTGTHTKRTPAQKRIRLLIGTVVVSCLVWLFVNLPYDILREERARLYGEEATSGTVLEMSSDPSPDFPGAKLIVKYKYVDPDGFPRTAEARMPDSEWQSYRKGATIKVIFVRTRPDLARLPNEVEPAFQIWLRELMN